MIMTIRRRITSEKRQFDILEGREFKYSGAIGKLHALQDIILSDDLHGEQIVGKLTKNPADLLSSATLAETRRRECTVTENDAVIGHFDEYISNDRNFYEIDADGKLFTVHRHTNSKFLYLEIVHNDELVAVIQSLQGTSGAENIYKLYILTEFDNLSRIFALFTLYFDNFENSPTALRGSGAWNISASPSRGLHIGYGRKREITVSFSELFRKSPADPCEQWLAEHFPEEDFYGRTSLVSE